MKKKKKTFEEIIKPFCLVRPRDEIGAESAVVSASAVAVPVYIIDRTAVTDFAYFVNARLCRGCQPLHTRQEWRIISVTAGDLDKSRKSNEAKCSRQADFSQ